MGIYTDPSQIESYNFYNYNYYESLSDIDKKLFKHNEHYSANKIDLHDLRKAFFKSSFYCYFFKGLGLAKDTPNVY